MFLVPKNFGIAGSMGILALNCIVGGLIGGIIVFVRIIVIFTEIIKVIAGHFWTQCPKVQKKKEQQKRHCQSIINNTSTCHLEHRHGSDPFLLHHRTGFHVLPVCQVSYNNS